MKIGLLTAGIGKAAHPRTLCAIAEHAERLGFGTLWAPEHVVLFDDHDSKYPYRDDGSFMARSTIDLLDPFIGLTYAAALCCLLDPRDLVPDQEALRAFLPVRLRL